MKEQEESGRLASNYFFIRANINTACEKNCGPIWYQKTKKKIKLFESTFLGC